MQAIGRFFKSGQQMTLFKTSASFIAKEIVSVTCEELEVKD